jgi:hypothetical protein
MSTVAHKQQTAPARLHRRRSVWLALAVLVASTTIVVGLPGSDDEQAVPSASPPHTASGEEYDGGVVPAQPPSTERYDGGVEEGTPDVTRRPGEQGSRPDRGPEEGSHLRAPGQRTN